MNGGLLAGALGAWAIAYCTIGLFFMVAHLWSRREGEFLLFGLFVLSLSVLNAGSALIVHPDAPAYGLLGNRLTLTGALTALAFQLHLALRYSGRARTWNVTVSYVLAALLMVWSWAVDLPDGDQGSAMLLRAEPGLRLSFSAAVIVGVLAAVLLMLDAFRSGKREAILLLGAAAVVGAAAGHDLTLSFTLDRRADETLSPYLLWIYVIGVAAMLLHSYRGTQGRLAETTSSLRARTEELRRSHAELEKVQSELVRKEQLAAVGELAASIAHEVRNPLAVIVNANAGLRRSTLSEDERETLLSIIEEETDRLNRIVGDLLRFARPVAARRSAVSVADLCDDVRRNGPAGYHITVDISDDPALEILWVDPGLFRVVLDNLVSNACQAMRPGGTVVVAVRRDLLSDGGEAIAFDVADSGHGMDPPVLQRATHPFFTTRPSGTGLGLPIVQRIVEAHGGELSLSSRPSAGTTATVRVPLMQRKSSSPVEPGEEWEATEDIHAS